MVSQSVSYWNHIVQVLWNEAYLSIKPELKHCSKDIATFLRDGMEQYDRKADDASF